MISGRIGNICLNRNMFKENTEQQWYVMRDLKRRNAKEPAYKQLQESGVKVFVPMKWQLVIRKGKKVREEVPFIQDLLFVCDSRQHLDPIVEKTRTLQYRWLRNTYREPMTVSDSEMEKFMFAISQSESPRYYLPEEITPQMYGRKIKIIGGSLNGYEGALITKKGSKSRWLLIEIKDCLAAGIEVLPEYIQFV